MMDGLRLQRSFCRSCPLMFMLLISYRFIPSGHSQQRRRRSLNKEMPVHGFSLATEVN